MRITPVDLYRMGNAASPRLDKIRMKDIEMYEQRGKIWIAANTGGISTFSVQGSGRNWWKLDQGIEIPSQLRVLNDYGNHWLWEPIYSMPLDDYQQALKVINDQFYKVS